MEGQIPASIRISLQDETFEISGSEQFVENHIGLYQDLIVQWLEDPPLAYAKPKRDPSQEYSPKSSDDTSTEEEERPANDLEAYEHIYTIQGEEVALLLNKIPGNNAGEQARNWTYLYLFGKYLAGIEEVSTDEIRDLSSEYRGGDRNRNFMRSIRSDRRNLQLKKESRRKFTVKLTRPGLIHAQELAQSLE
jgi:hypothetical protein